jgi:hypothetical protein
MKTLSLSKNILPTILFLCLVFFACKKETSQNDLTAQEEEEASLAISESEAESEIMFNDIFDNVMGANNDVGLAGTGIFGRISTNSFATETARLTGCFILSVTRLVQGQDFPLRIEIDFGAGCPGKDGRIRTGKIITEYTGRLLVPGKSATTSFIDYTVDSIKVEGNLKITNTGNSNLRQFSFDVSGGKLTRPNGNYARWNSHKEITQLEGLATPEIHIDDVFGVTGYASGEIKTSSFATSWESNIIEPLRKRYSCSWLSKGVVKIIRHNLSPDSKWIGLLNYGNGTCDNKATLTVNGLDHQIILN